MNVLLPNSGVLSTIPTMIDPAGRPLDQPDAEPDWSRLNKPFLLPAPFPPAIIHQYPNEVPETGVKVVSIDSVPGSSAITPRWFGRDFALYAPPAHPSHRDPMQELSNNSPQNRAQQLWGHLRLNDLYPSYDESVQAEMLWAMLLLYFETFPNAEGVCVRHGHPMVMCDPVKRWTFGLPLPREWFDAVRENIPIVLAISRAEFWESSPPGFSCLSPWVPLQATLRSRAPTKPAPGTVVYQRFIPALSKILRYRLIDRGPPPVARASNGSGSADDLSSLVDKLPMNGESTDITGTYGGAVPLFAQWQNSDRVNAGWRQRGPLKEHYDFLQECVADPSQWGLIGTWQDVSSSGQLETEHKWGFVEVYWAAHSNVARWVQPTDMGIHALVGNEAFRGPDYVRTWLGAAVHLAFLLEPQALRCVSEPRASNAKMIGYECLVGGQVERLIDLGHKRSALVVWNREGFFQLSPMGPLPKQQQQQQ